MVTPGSAAVVAVFAVVAVMAVPVAVVVVSSEVLLVPEPEPETGRRTVPFPGEVVPGDVALVVPPVPGVIEVEVFVELPVSGKVVVVLLLAPVVGVVGAVEVAGQAQLALN